MSLSQSSGKPEIEKLSGTARLLCWFAAAKAKGTDIKTQGLEKKGDQFLSGVLVFE